MNKLRAYLCRGSLYEALMGESKQAELMSASARYGIEVFPTPNNKRL